MGTRQYNFITGISTPALPTAGTPVASADVMTKGYADGAYAALAATVITGTRAAPTSIVAGTGIPFSSTAGDNFAFVQGAIVGTTTVSATPQIAPGSTLGQRLKIVHRSATNLLALSDGTGLDLDGNWLGDDVGRELDLWWDGTNWKEEGRR